MHTDIEPERFDDLEAIREVVRAAFDHHRTVADMVDLIRDSPHFVADLSLVARRADAVVGHVMLSHAHLLDDEGVQRQILTLSPLSVAPDVQRQGIGSALVRAALAAAEELGEALVTLEGSPRYYPRFGFEDCRPFGIEINLPSWAPPEAGMVYRLSAYSPQLRGRLVYPPAFAVATAD